MSYKRITDPDAANPGRSREHREMNKGVGKGGNRWKKRGEPQKVDRVLKRDNTLRVLSKEGMLPLEYMLNVMRDDNEPTFRRDDMAKAAAPYLHPRLQSVEVKSTVKHERTDWSDAELVEFLNDCRTVRDGVIGETSGSSKPN